MAQSRPISIKQKQKKPEIIILKDRVIHRKVLAAFGELELPEGKIRCMVPICVGYNEEYALDAYLIATIRGAVAEGYLCQIFISPKQEADYDKWVGVNKEVLAEFGSKVVLINKNKYYWDAHFQEVSKKIHEYYAKNPEKHKKFLEAVEKDIKTYAENHGVDLEKPTEKEKIKNHVITEAEMVISWALMNPDLITVALYEHFTAAMGVGVSQAPAMNIGFSKHAVILMNSEKKVNGKSPFAIATSDIPRRRSSPSGVESHSPVIDPDVKELVLTLADSGADPEWTAKFYLAINKLKKSPANSSSPSPTSSPSDSEGELSSSPLKAPGAGKFSSGFFNRQDAFSPVRSGVVVQMNEEIKRFDVPDAPRL